MKTRWIFAAALGVLSQVGCATEETGGDPAGGPGAAGAQGGSGGSADGGAGGQRGGAGGNGGGGGDEGGSGGATSSSSSSASSASSGGAGGEGGEPPDLCNNDGIRDQGEQCDGSDFGDQSCATFGLGSGDLVCNPFCGIVVSNCVPKETCGDGQDNDEDGLWDCDDVADCLMAAVCIDSCASPPSLSIPSFPYETTQGRPDTYTSSCNSGGDSGGELIFEITANNDGQLAVTAWPEFGSDVSLSIRTTCNDVTSEVACVDAISGASSAEVLGMPVTAGQTFFLVVDAVNETSEGFVSLNIDIPPPEFDWQCTDRFDNDADGYLDCDDATSCQVTQFCIAGPKSTGQACFDHNECQSLNNDPVCLDFSQGFPDGYCSQFCDLAAPDCLGDAVCFDLGISEHGVCLDGCTSNAECRPGYLCGDKGLSTLVCTLAPEANCTDQQDNDADKLIDCSDPDGCQTSPDCVPGPQAPGSACTTSSQCDTFAGNDPLCITQQLNFWPGGYCSEWCTVNADCGPGGVCSTWAIWNQGQCLKKCSGIADCRPGYQCGDLFGSIPETVCFW
ncbi:MAG: hypothetical protein WKG00_29170 [Polyangiaceae bacterium]